MKLSLIVLSLLCLSNLDLFLFSNSGESDFASQNSTKQNPLNFKFKVNNKLNSRLNRSRMAGKHGTPFFLETRTEVLDFASGKMRLSVELGSHGQFDEVHYKWIIPSGVELSWGSLDGVLTNLSVDNSAKLDIEVANLNMNINQNIILLVERNEGDQALGSSFVIASRKDLTEEYLKTPNQNVDENAQLKTMAIDDDTSTKKKFIY
jgi:hypothetical protein